MTATLCRISFRATDDKLDFTKSSHFKESSHLLTKLILIYVEETKETIEEKVLPICVRIADFYSISNCKAALMNSSGITVCGICMYNYNKIYNSVNCMVNN